MKHSEGFLNLVNDAKTRVREVTVAETQQQMRVNPEIRLIDVREDNEWQAGHAAGAIHLGKGIIERDIETVVPKKDAKLILYCGGVIARRLRRTRYSEWVIRTFSRWPVAGERGRKAVAKY